MNKQTFVVLFAYKSTWDEIKEKVVGRRKFTRSYNRDTMLWFEKTAFNHHKKYGVGKLIVKKHFKEKPGYAFLSDSGMYFLAVEK